MTAPEVIAALLHVRSIQREIMHARYNIAPTQRVPVVRVGAGGERELVAMHWGLIPHWAKDLSIASRLINARSETAAEKPAFREAFKSRRCIVPATGFYEWKKIGARKQPYFIHRVDGAPMLFAGLWEEWIDKATGERVESCTILTTDANAILRTLHDRMPVILDRSGAERWLDATSASGDGLQALLQPAPDGWCAMHPVSSRVNTPKHDDPQLIQAVDLSTMEATHVPKRQPRDTGPGLFN